MISEMKIKVIESLDLNNSTQQLSLKLLLTSFDEDNCLFQLNLAQQRNTISNSELNLL